MSISKKDFDTLHEKVDNNSESLARIEGKLDGMTGQKKESLTFFGALIALVLGVVNIFR